MPNALLHSLKHYKVLHERVVICTVTVADTPFVPKAKRVTVEKLGKGFFAVRISYGFFETPDIPEALALARAQGLALEPDATTYFLGRETLVPGDNAQHETLAGGAVYVAGVQCAVAGALLSPAARPGGGTGHAGLRSSQRVNQRLQIRAFRQQRMHRMIRAGAGLADQRGAAAGAQQALARIPRQNARAEYCASRTHQHQMPPGAVTSAASRASLR